MTTNISSCSRLYICKKKTVKVTDKDMLVEYTEISPYRIDYLYVLSITGR